MKLFKTVISLLDEILNCVQIPLCTVRSVTFFLKHINVISFKIKTAILLKLKEKNKAIKYVEKEQGHC